LVYFIRYKSLTLLWSRMNQTYSNPRKRQGTLLSFLAKPTIKKSKADNKYQQMNKFTYNTLNRTVTSRAIVQLKPFKLFEPSIFNLASVISVITLYIHV
jgi:hypothetical protein